MFGEIALITNEKRTASVKAETDLVLLKINKELLHRIIKEFKN
ncbi:MAG: cyclic nucleotide-binding domain-containing protein [Candidatus Peribacteria bacterium]|nr:cyclic nucleotide-binding domain-containing protein [Candidatus Peribacteria bacterium]